MGCFTDGIQNPSSRPNRWTFLPNRYVISLECKMLLANTTKKRILWPSIVKYEKCVYLNPLHIDHNENRNEFVWLKWLVIISLAVIFNLRTFSILYSIFVFCLARFHWTLLFNIKSNILLISGLIFFNLMFQFLSNNEKSSCYRFAFLVSNWF